VCAIVQIDTSACIYSKSALVFHSSYISNVSFEKMYKICVLLKAAFA
jgi:hypothetical protein